MFNPYISSSAGWNGLSGLMGPPESQYTWEESQNHDSSMDASGESYESPPPLESDVFSVQVPETEPQGSTVIPETQISNSEGIGGRKGKIQSKPWTRDIIDGVSAEKFLVNWLALSGVWSEWRKGTPKTKTKIYSDLRVCLEEAGYVPRDDGQISGKVGPCARSLVSPFETDSLDI